MPEQVQHTLYQVSTATALVEGIYQGAVQVSTLREHGDLGLGTFEGLDGEMVIVDGHFFQVRSDGSVREVPDDVLSPFAAVTAFSPDQSIVLDNRPDMSYLSSRFDVLRSSDNFFFALRVDGTRTDDFQVLTSSAVNALCPLSRWNLTGKLAKSVKLNPVFQLAG